MTRFIERVCYFATCTYALQEALRLCYNKKVQVGKDQEKAQSEKDSHSKNQGGKPAFSFLIRSNTIHLTTSVKEHKICYPMHITIE